MSNFNEDDQNYAFRPLFQPIENQTANYLLTVFQQVKDLADEINQLEVLLEKANDLLFNNKNLSSVRRLKLEDTIRTATQKLAQDKEKFKELNGQAIIFSTLEK